MKVLRYILKWLGGLLGRQSAVSGGIDSHKWESKLEVFSRLSGHLD